MNRDDFKSAYSKIALSDECKAQMKAELLRRMSGAPGKAPEAPADELVQTTQEIKLAPKKNTPAKTAVIAGSAAAAVAVIAVGAGWFMNRNGLTQPDPVTSATEEATSESADFDDAFTEDGYYMRRTEGGVLHFQELTTTNAEHTQPSQKYDKLFDGAYEFRSRYAGYVQRIGSDELYEMEQQDSGLPLGSDIQLYEVTYSGTGMTLVYRSEDGTKQANLSVSTDRREFTPITLPDGSYLTPAADWRSLFSLDEKNVRDPAVYRMGAGSFTAEDGTEYYSAVYGFPAYIYDSANIAYWARLDARGITLDEFAACLDMASPFNVLSDHWGVYSADGSYADMSEIYPGDNNAVIPDGEYADTAYGPLYLNTLTYRIVGWDGGFRWNVENSGKLGSTAYSMEDIADFTGLSVLKDLTIPIDYTSAEISYAAEYEGISADDGMGIRGEMLPGDDPAQYEEAQGYVNGVEYYDNASAEAEQEDYSYACYTTDKLDYFSGKTRTGARYSVTFTGEDEFVRLTAFDSFKLFDEYMTLFGRYPAKSSPDFVSGAEGCGRLYAGSGYADSGRFWDGFFKANGKYVYVECRNTGLKKFSGLMAELYSGGAVKYSGTEESYFEKTCADGILKFQEFTRTNAEHSQPEKSFINPATQVLFPNWIDERAVAYLINQIHISGVTISEGLSSENGLTLIYRSKDGSKQINFSISSDRNEFTPITLSDGSYLVPAAAPRSSFVRDTLYNFIDPYCIDLAAGSAEDGGDTYYSSEFEYKLRTFYELPKLYARIDARNITLDEFLSCLDGGTMAGITADYRGVYDPGEGGEGFPEPETVQTSMGELVMNRLTYPEKPLAAGYRNVQADEGYTQQEAADFSYIKVLAELTPEMIFGVSGKSGVNYFAMYDEIYSGDGSQGGYGANTEMLPGDDPEEFAEAQKHLVTGEDHDENGGTEIRGCYYTTDKLDYFRNKTRTAAGYVLHFRADNGGYAEINVMDSFSVQSPMQNMLFGRYPAAVSDNFGAQGYYYDDLYAGRGLDEDGAMCYLGGFVRGNGHIYMTLRMTGTDLETFAKTLAILYSDDPDPDCVFSGKLGQIANGELALQSGWTTSLDHEAPGASIGAQEADSRLKELAPDAVMPGSDEWFSAQAEKLRETDPLGAGEMEQTRPLLNELDLTGAYSSGTGLALEFTKGGRYLNVSVSTRRNEFLPLTDGGGEYQEVSESGKGWCTLNGGFDFIDPERLTIAAAGRRHGGEEWYVGRFTMTISGKRTFFRVESRGMTREQFTQGLCAVSPAAYGDHMGYYSPDGSGARPGYVMDVSVPKDDLTLPAVKTAETEWGALRLNPLTYTNSVLSWADYNVEYRSTIGESWQDGYTLGEAAEFSGLDVLRDAGKFLNDSNAAYYYCAGYEGVTSGIYDENRGINPEMLPGDSRQDYDEAQEHAVVSDSDYPTSCYTTDKLNYFRDKKRTGARYTLTGSDNSGGKVSISVTDDIMLTDSSNVIFGRLPAEKTQFCGTEVTAGYGRIRGSEYYLGGFSRGGKLYIVEVRDMGLREFARYLAAVIQDNAEPEAVQSAQYPERSYDLSGSFEKNYAAGSLVYNELGLLKYSEQPNDARYFTTAGEAVKAYSGAYERLWGFYPDSAEILMRGGWTIVPEESAQMGFENGVPGRVTLCFTSGDRKIYASVSDSAGYAGDPLRIRLPDGKGMYPTGQTAESTLYGRDEVLNTHYLRDNFSDAVTAAIAGRCEEGRRYCVVDICPTVSGFDTPGRYICAQTEGLSESELADLLAALYYGLDKMPETCGENLSGTDDYEEAETTLGEITLNPLAYYGEAGWDADSGETSATAAKARELLSGMEVGYALPDGASGITRRIRTSGGRRSDSVSFTDRSGAGFRFCRLDGVDDVPHYGEEYGLASLVDRGTLLGDRRWVIARGNLPDGTEMYYAITDSVKYISVSAAGCTLEQFVRILSET